jgi:hypothetical protein
MNKATLARIICGLTGLLVLGWVSLKLIDEGPEVKVAAGSVKGQDVLLPTVSQTVQTVHASVQRASPAARFEEFNQLSQEVLDQLPPKASMRGLGFKQVHHTPTAIIEAGRKLGQIAEAWHQHPELKKPAAEFYRDCSLSQQLTDTVRILCLSNWATLAADIDSLERPQDNSMVPERLLKLALYMASTGT